MLDYFLDLGAVKLLWKICMGFLCAKNVYVGKLTENVVKTFCNSIRLFILHVTKLHTSELSCMNIFYMPADTIVPQLLSTHTQSRALAFDQAPNPRLK